jgi:hypothetical protein
VLWLGPLSLTQASKERSLVHVHDLTRSQLAQPGVVRRSHPTFFRALRKFCGERSVPERVERTVRNHSSKQIAQLASRLRELLRQASAMLSDYEPLAEAPSMDVYLVIGCGKTDGFALLDGDAPKVFFDLATLVEPERRDMIGLSFVIHELLHGFHFAAQPELASRNRGSLEERLLKALLAEGTATYHTKRVTGLPDRLVFGAGLYDRATFRRWRHRARARKPRYGKRLARFLRDPNAEPNLTTDLMWVVEPDRLADKRHGYLYGYEIVERLVRRRGLRLDHSYEASRGAALRYFGLEETGP